MRALFPLLLLATGCSGDEIPATASDAVDPGAASVAPRIATIAMPGGELSVDFVEITRGDGSTFWIAQTETTWEVFDLFFLRTDEEAEVDGITGPSRSVFPVTRGFGHDAMPVLGMTFQSAQAFCRWLTARDVEHVFRLPTEEEWKTAAGPAPADWDTVAWHAGNAEQTPHAVQGKAPNPLGLYDMGGNLAEWVVSGETSPLALGGSWLQPVEELGRDARLRYDSSWQQRDPQWPKSVWWMSDAGYVGFRLVFEQRP